MPIHKTLETAGVPVHVWSKELDVKSEQQLRNTASLPCMFHHIAVMPDVHFGIGSTVGSVLATRQAIIPAAVGVDIGCGMMAVKTPINASMLPDNLKALRLEIERCIPVGFQWHEEPVPASVVWHGWEQYHSLPRKVTLTNTKKARCQLGTLGGGNHFIEVCLDTEQNVWVMLHSGSRGIGNEIAKVHIDIAKGLFGESLKDLADPDLAYLAEGTPEFAAYWRDLQWAQDYARMNREIMMVAALKAVAKIIHNDWTIRIPRVFEINCHHNYAQKEVHFGTEVYVTRKGAVRAASGDLGIIPGSMGAKSFIVRGRGSENAFDSCSHGAGRKMSRGEAKRVFTEADLREQTAGVECRTDRGVLDEIPGAYKDIQTVMDNQTDLVEILAELKQCLCVKG